MNALQQISTIETGWSGIGLTATPFAAGAMGAAAGRCCTGVTSFPGQPMPMMPEMPMMPQMAMVPEMSMMPPSATMPCFSAGFGAGGQLSMMTQLLELLTGLLTGMMLSQSLRSMPHHGHASQWSGTYGSGHADAASPADLSRSTPLGSVITRDALQHDDNESGLCLKHVGAVLRRHGIKCGPAPSAYMVGDQLASNPQLKEVDVPQSKLSGLPAGAIIVWDKGPKLPDGHISIALGDGREWSGPIRQQMQLGTHYRVFLPQ